MPSGCGSITVLVRDMDVNLAGAEVILHLRDDLRAMQRQFDEILRASWSTSCAVQRAEATRRSD